MRAGVHRHVLAVGKKLQKMRMDPLLRQPKKNAMNVRLLDQCDLLDGCWWAHEDKHQKQIQRPKRRVPTTPAATMAMMGDHGMEAQSLRHREPDAMEASLTRKDRLHQKMVLCQRRQEHAKLLVDIAKLEHVLAAKQSKARSLGRQLGVFQGVRRRR